MVIKGYRGLLADAGQEKIRLTTTDGRTGYRIVKFQALSNYPRGNSPESVLKIYKTNQTVVDDIIEFTDSNLLSALFYEGNANDYYITQVDVIFDREIFNQDIYITCKCSDGTMNYYIELEQIKLSAAQAELLIVKDLRKEMWTRP